MQRTVTSLLTANPGVESITVCGHSLGGALASLCAFDLAISELNKAMPLCLLYGPASVSDSPCLLSGVLPEDAVGLCLGIIEEQGMHLIVHQCLLHTYEHTHMLGK